jgi:elongation factor G
MSKHATSDIRNIAFIGGPATGKTTLVEALLHATGVLGRMGLVSDGTTVSDFRDDEKDKQHSLQSSFMYTTHRGCH